MNKKIIVVLILAFNFINSIAQENNTVYYDAEKQNKKSQGIYDANLKEQGKWTYWHQNGKKLAEGVYKDGEKIGKWL